VRRVLLGQAYSGDDKFVEPDAYSHLTEQIRKGDINAQNLVAGYGHLLYRRYGNMEEVARRLQLDSRTVKKYIAAWESGEDAGGLRLRYREG